MARCGCNNTCNCRMDAGSCTTVEGFGTPIAPYRVNVTVDGVTVICGPNGLQSNVTINELDTDSVDMHVVENSPSVFTISADVFIQDNGTGPLATGPGGGVNLLKLNPGQGVNGLYVACEDIQDCVGEAVSLVAGDCLEYIDNGPAAGSINVVIADTPTTNGVKCTPTGLQVIPSTDPGNTTVLGTDGNIFTPGSSLAAEGAGTNCVDVTVTGAGTAGDPFVVSGTLIVDPACPLGVCGPAGLCVSPTPVAVNDLAQNVDLAISGSGQPGDPWLLTQTCVPVPISADTQRPGPGCIGVTGDTCNGFQIHLGISDDTDQVLECRGDGLFVCAQYGRSEAAGSPSASIGPLNGTFGDTPFNAPACVTMNNPSTCKSMNVRAHFRASIELTANAGTGNFVGQIQGNVNGGPFINAAGPASLLNPTGANEGNTFQLYDDGFFVNIPAGGSVTMCTRLVVRGQTTVNGRANGNSSILLTGETTN